MISNTLFKLFHLADSALPVGGYAYSNGLEYAVKSGFIASVHELDEYLISFVNQMNTYELSFVKASFEAATTDELQEISTFYNVSLLNPPVQKAGRILGKNWMRLLKQIYADLPDYPLSDYDYPIVFGWVSAQMNISIGEACQLYVYMAVRDQISAVIRLGTLGPTQAHQIQNKLLAYVSQRDYIQHIPAFKQAYKTAYLLENMQLSHKSLYTKLFQN